MQYKNLEYIIHELLRTTPEMDRLWDRKAAKEWELKTGGYYIIIFDDGRDVEGICRQFRHLLKIDTYQKKTEEFMNYKNRMIYDYLDKLVKEKDDVCKDCPWFETDHFKGCGKLEGKLWCEWFVKIVEPNRKICIQEEKGIRYDLICKKHLKVKDGV